MYLFDGEVANDLDEHLIGKAIEVDHDGGGKNRRFGTKRTGWFLSQSESNMQEGHSAAQPYTVNSISVIS
jgi:hypothetical protein